MKIKDLYGLVLMGGRSSRMKMNKASLEFHGIKQSVYAYNLLQNFCEGVFISCREDQKDEEGTRGLPQIYDTAPYLNIGPLGGILSARQQYPSAAWLVLACDLPFVNSKTIQRLIQKRNPGKMATAYISTHDNLPEPLCAIYERQSYALAIKYFENGQTCPRKFLINSDVELITQLDPKSLDNVNTPEEYSFAKRDLTNDRQP